MAKNKVDDKTALEVIFNSFDNRLFGTMVPMKPEVKEEAGLNKDFPTTFVGPIQILPTVSLHDVVIDEVQITSPFRDPGEKGSDGGNLGMKYVVRFGLYLGTGIYNPYRGEHCQTTSEDLKDFDDAMVHASSVLRSSTKTWCQSILFLRVMYKKGSGNGFRDLASLVTAQTKDNEPPNSPNDLTLVMDRLANYLGNQNVDSDIEKVKVYVANYARDLYPELENLKYLPIDQFSPDDKDYCCEYLWLIEVRHSNLNGDPNNDNRPRVFENTETGFATPERIKRWVRDYHEMKGKNIFVSRNIPRQSAAQRFVNILSKESESNE